MKKRKKKVTGENFGRAIKTAKYVDDVVDQSINGTARLQVDVGKAIFEKVITKVDDVFIGKVDDCIAIRMSRGHMNKVSFLVVEIDRRLRCESDNR